MPAAAMARLLLLVHILIQAAFALQEGNRCQITASSQEGVCKLSHECPLAAKLFREQRIRPTTCGFQGSTPVICCPEGLPPAPSRDRPGQGGSWGAPLPANRNPFQGNSGSSDDKRLSERKCEEYSGAVKQVVAVLGLSLGGVVGSQSSSTCVYREPLIVGGEETSVGEYPHMAGVGWPLLSGGVAWVCGGSLISAQSVLTAAHCTGAYKASNSISEHPTVVRVGEHNLVRDDDGAFPQDIDIADIVRHPDYKPASKYNDIAILKLIEPAIFGDNVRPCCLWQSPNFNKDKAIASGWGSLGNGMKGSDTLQKVLISIIDQDQCSEFYPSSRSLRQGLLDTQMCAGELAGEKDSCGGDSGGPLQLTEPESDCIFYLVGITSFGKGCGYRGTAGVYTRVSSYVDWIESEVWPEEYAAEQ